MRKLKTISCVIAVVLALGLSVEPSAALPSLSKLRQEWQSASRSISRIQQKLKPLKKQQKVATKNLVTAKHRLDVTVRNLRDTQAQLQNTKRRLAYTLTSLQIVQDRLRQRNDQLSGRLVDSYKYGDVSYMGVVLGATDFWDLLNGAYVVRKVMHRDVELLDAIRADKREIEQKKSVLEEQKRVRAQLEVRHRCLNLAAREQTAECRQILQTIDQQRAALERQLAEEQASSRQIAAMIRRMRSTPEGRKWMAKPWHGGFIMPVNGRITSPFGMRYHPILHSRRMHTGTDIAAPSGTAIHASAGGVVMYAGYLDRVYGYTVILDHGGGVSTFYGHCSSVCVGRGQAVRQGQTIARVGSTGLSTGPHVHFEKQINGRPVSP